MALLSGTLRQPWLIALCRSAEDPKRAGSSLSAHPGVVAHVVFDTRLACFGGRENMPRSLGSVLACVVALFLGRRMTTHLRPGRVLPKYSDVQCDDADDSLHVVDPFIGSVYTLRWRDSNASLAIRLLVPIIYNSTRAPDGAWFVYPGGGSHVLATSDPSATPRAAFPLCKRSCKTSKVLCASETILVVCCTFYSRADETVRGTMPNCRAADACLMHPCGNFAVLVDGEVLVYRGDGSADVLRRFRVDAAVYAPSGLRCSAAGEFVVACGRAGLFVIDGDGVMRRRLSFRCFASFAVCGASVHALLAHWEPQHVHRALGTLMHFD